LIILQLIPCITWNGLFQLAGKCLFSNEAGNPKSASSYSSSPQCQRLMHYWSQSGSVLITLAV